MKSATFVGVDIQGSMQTRKMLFHFESNVGNVVVTIVDSQRIVEFMTADSLVTKAHITINLSKLCFQLTSKMKCWCLMQITFIVQMHTHLVHFSRWFGCGLFT